MIRHALVTAAVSWGSVCVAAAPKVEFNRDIRPILFDHCVQCHGPDDRHREANLRLDIRQGATAKLEGGKAAVVPGDANASEMIRRVTAADPADRMPPAKVKKPLKPEQVALLKRWIEQGADWENHWSFEAPKRSAVPKHAGWSDHPIDAFVLDRLKAEGLEPSPEADRRTLIRRVTFDLTGLPPTPAEVEAFVNDKSPRAYEKVVDRLLASPHYGERMALNWLDAARYGDTSVFHADGPRDMWAWRDGVVRAYNGNQPFDRFSTEQLAGDLIPNATPEQQVASAFNRNNGTTDEGGAIPEEYRVEYAVDRVKTTSMVWMGLTMECAQCHEHKYDPISQTDYYRFYAFFNVSADKGMQTRKGNAAPLVELLDPENKKQLPGVREQLAELDKRMKAHAATVSPAFDAWVKAAEAEPDRRVELPGGATAHFALDEGEGKVATCAADPKRKAHVKGGKAQWSDAKLAKGLKLDGKVYLDAGDVGNFERTDAFSYGCWVYPEANSAGAPIARMDDRSAYRGYDLYLSKGQVSVHMVHNWPGNAIKVTTKKKLKLKAWHHVFVTYDGSSKAKGVDIYVNGEKWDWNIEQDGLSKTMRTQKTLFVGSRNPGSRFKGVVDDVRLYPRRLSEVEVKALAGADPIGPILAKQAKDRTDKEIAALRDHYLNHEDEAYRKWRADHDKLKAREAELAKPVTTVMVMRDMPKPRDTFVLMRGAYDAPSKKKVEPGTPSTLPPMPEGAPANRLGLAQWLFRDDHPLTARVAVNRYWQMLFGAGLVATPEDFGTQGQYPSHPKLLDWLAVDFRESGWNVKRMLKQMVMSATYRQSARQTPALREKDPENRLLARGPRFRLQGEFIRDGALAVSGLLVREMGGPGVKPYQPPGLWNEVSLSGNVRFKKDSGAKLYRRSLYTYWKRSAPPPSMRLFDAPTREKCVVARPRTNTPLQALVTLNDVQFVEAARHLAQRMMKEGGDAPESRVDFAFLLATARAPKPAERSVLLQTYRSALERYRSDVESAKQLLSYGDSERDASLDAAEHAAWTVVASMILNLDETLTKG